jgi:ABC-type antimicrobial peptide transport system permease subunit
MVGSQMNKKILTRKPFRIFLNLIFTIIIGCAIFIPIELLLESIYPSTASDGHVVMPIGQIIGSVILSSLISIIISIILIRKMYKK